MTIHRPGLPTDLPKGETLWARWALLAAVDATTEDQARVRNSQTGVWIDSGGVHFDDCGSTWWTLSRIDAGRFVLYGEDESSDVKWHRPPIDMLAGGPAWLPYDELHDRLEGYELGCVYWYESGIWNRAPYPDDLGDDGLDCGMSRFIDRAEVLSELSCRITATDGGPTADRLLSAAEAYSLDPDPLLERLRRADGEGGMPDLLAVARALAFAGLTAPAV